MSAAKAFFDTNVLLYLLSQDTTKADRAEELVAGGGIVSVQVLNEFASIALRKLAMQLGEVRDALATIRTLCTVKALDVETHDLGLDLIERYRFSFYASLIVSAALRAGCTILYAEDLQHTQRVGSLSIRNPFVCDSNNA